ncbi:hypothetical protein [Mucilaginibacter lacusdianchii]|uniref:hypothetical protein n=1 Tax=Mucilaginibacter lacusdianchii TaxID=2684211 RepID=UPI00131E5E49|nr:hypothetical protein [Mucilaginibacter sp. JXJ CY 39]
MSKTKLQTLDLEKELLIRIGNESDEHSVSWDVLKNVGDKLEALILTLAKYNLDAAGNSNLDNFKLDFSGFYNGSAVPAFRLNPHPIPSLFDNGEARKSVVADFTKVVSSIDKGNYQQIADWYNMPSAKNDVIKKLYDFTNSAGTTPVTIVKRQDDNKFKKVYSIRRLNKEVYDQLIVKEQTLEAADVKPDESTAVARVIIKKDKSGKISRKTSELYNDKEATLSLKLDRIETDNSHYIFKTPILFQLYQEGKGIIIENEQLDLYAGGRTTTEAKESLFKQFSHSYNRLNQLQDNQLSSYLLQVKQYYNLIIKSVSNK